jgi:vacuolar iron transporter family protein
MPLLVTAMAPVAALIPFVSGPSLASLALLGGLAARAGGAGVTTGTIRVTFWGTLAHGADRRRWGAVRNGRVSVARHYPIWR